MSDVPPSEGKFRTTSPMQAYTGTDVIVGIVVLAIGLFLVAVLPYLY